MPPFWETKTIQKGKTQKRIKNQQTTQGARENATMKKGIEKEAAVKRGPH